MVQLSFLAAAAAVASTAFASPSPCRVQSCKIADASGSTGAGRKTVEAYDGKLKSQTPKGTKCIYAWWNSGFNLDAANSRRRDVRDRIDMNMMELVDTDNEMPRIVARRSCKPNMLLWFKGTLELGEFGSFVGGPLKSALADDSSIDMRGMDYKADWGGDYCAGIPGGKLAAKFLNKAAAECPTSKIIMAGYSQGAMVSRIGTAFANPTARSQVVGILNFGDPFNGAPVKGFDSNLIKTFCHNGDGVCDGELKIRPAHLTYGKDIGEGAKWVKQRFRNASK